MTPLLNNRWTRSTTIAAPDYVAKKLRDQAAALDARRIEINARQTELDAQAEALTANAAESANVAAEADTIALNIVEVQRDEIALRQELAEHLVAVRTEAKTHADKAAEDLKAVEAKAFDAVVAAGWNEAEPQVRGFVNLNLNVRAARTKVESIRSRSSDYVTSKANADAIEAIRGQLNEMGAASLKAAGV